MTTDTYIRIAQITKPHGIRGALCVVSFCDPSDNLLVYDRLYLEDHKLMEGCKLKWFKRPNFFLMEISGVTDRNQAELWRGRCLFIQRSQLPQTAEDEFYYEDLIGLAVYDEHQNLYGHVQAVTDFGAQDTLVVQDLQPSEILIPFTQSAILKVDLEQKQLVVASVFLSDR